jgi:hypothetical protein
VRCRCARFCTESQKGVSGTCERDRLWRWKKWVITWTRFPSFRPCSAWRLRRNLSAFACFIYLFRKIEVCKGLVGFFARIPNGMRLQWRSHRDSVDPKHSPCFAERQVSRWDEICLTDVQACRHYHHEFKTLFSDSLGYLVTKISRYINPNAEYNGRILPSITTSSPKHPHFSSDHSSCSYPSSTPSLHPSIEFVSTFCISYHPGHSHS